MSLQVTTPAQRLNNDLLWYLFGHVCISDPFNGPMSASQVCQRWRLVALGSPLMWGNITIQLYTNSQKHKLALAYFERSQSIPITLSIEASRHFNSWEKKNLLVPYAKRFRSVNVKASSGSLANILWTEMDMPMPRLEVFETVIVSDTSRIRIRRKIDTNNDDINAIPLCDPIRHLVRWSSWNLTGVTTLTLDTTNLRNKPDLDDIYHMLATTCRTIQNFEYKGLISCIDNARAKNRTRLVFPDLRSLTVLSPDNMVPLLKFMIILDLESLTLRDFCVYPARATPVTESESDSDEFIFTPDPDGFLRAIRQWTTIKHLAIYGVDDDDLLLDLSLLPEMISYVKSLQQLTSLELCGIGVANSLANALFMYDSLASCSTENLQPLLPQLSRFLLAIVDMSPSNNLYNFLMARQRHNLPRLKKLSINLEYVQHLSNLGHMEIIRSLSDESFVFADPEVGKYIGIDEVNLREW